MCQIFPKTQRIHNNLQLTDHKDGKLLEQEITETPRKIPKARELSSL
jgi:hypothetical protein